MHSKEALDHATKEKEELEALLASKEKAWTEEKRELRSRLDILQKNCDRLNLKQEELTRRNGDLQDRLASSNSVKSEQESQWEAEREDLLEKIASNMEIHEERNRLKDRMIKEGEEKQKNLVDMLDKKMRLLIDEKKSVETELKGLRTAAQETEKGLHDEIADSRLQNLELVRVLDQRDALRG